MISKDSSDDTTKRVGLRGLGLPFIAIELIVIVILLLSGLWLWSTGEQREAVCATQIEERLLVEEFNESAPPALWSRGNLSYSIPYALNCFTPNNVLYGNDELRIDVVHESSFCRGKTLPFSGGAFSSQIKFKPPFRLACRLKAAKGSGVITGCYTFTGPPHTEHNEVDLEILGKDTTKAQLNFFRSSSDLNNEEVIELGFDAAEDFHDYELEVGERSVKWYVDGKMIKAIKLRSGLSFQIPQQAIVSAWAAEDPVWGGKFSTDFKRSSAYYKWLKVFYTGCTPNADR